MFFPHERRRSHHPADLHRDDRRFHHPDLTKLGGWRAMQKEAEIPGTRWNRNASGRCAWA